MQGEAELELVRRHVAEGDRHVQQQLALIARLERLGLDTLTAQELLADFERTLDLHKAHQERLTVPSQQRPMLGCVGR